MNIVEDADTLADQYQLTHGFFQGRSHSHVNQHFKKLSSSQNINDRIPGSKQIYF